MTLSGEIQAVWRIESAKLIAALARMVRDVGVAEELAQEAFVVALERWPKSGLPDKPGAWLMTTAKRRALDHLRHRKMADAKHTAIADGVLGAPPTGTEAIDDVEMALDDDIGDGVLRLMFVACHPVLGTEARVALTLRLVGGLTTAEIARALMISEATAAQRIVRAKRTLADKGVRFEVPGSDERGERIASVLDVLYAIFNEGYSATAGDDWIRPALCEDALRLCRVLARLAPAEPEVHGLAALMEIQASRLHARTGHDGDPVLLLAQNRARWDQLLIHRGLAALTRAEALGGALGPYALQAAIAACHARARRAEDTDWSRITRLYEVLGQVTPSPIVELNRAVAVSMSAGPAAALPLVDALMGDPRLVGYHLLPSVRADLLAKLGRTAEARTELERAAAWTQNARERSMLLERAARLT